MENKKDTPTIFESETSNLVKGSKEVAKEASSSVGNLFSVLKGPKTIVFALVVIILIELMIGTKVLTTSIPKSGGSLEPVSGGKIVISSDKKGIPLWDTVDVAVKVSTGGHVTDGTDLLLSFNPNLLEATGSPVFTKGNIYKEFPLISVDNKTGLVKVSGITSSDEGGFNGTGTFGTLHFKAKKVGMTTLAVTFKPGVTTDSNIIETKSNNDILDIVYNLELKIGGLELGPAQIAESDSCEGFQQICWDSSGKGGIQKCVGGRKKDGICSWDAKLTKSCSACEVK